MVCSNSLWLYMAAVLEGRAAVVGMFVSHWLGICRRFYFVVGVVPFSVVLGKELLPLPVVLAEK